MIYVCIPAHNEAATVGLLLWKVRKALGEFGRDYRVVVLDDASTDGTDEVLRRYRRSLPITLLRSDERLGYARSVERLLRHAVDEAPYPKRDCAVILQGDFTESPDDVIGLVKAVEGGADIVAGCLAPGGVRAPVSVRVTRGLARLALGRALRRAPVSDPLSGLRAYRIIVLKKALRDLQEDELLFRSEGWAANVDLLRVLAPHARRIAETPLHVRYDRRARPSRFQALPTLLSLTRLRGSTRWPAPGTEAA